MTELLQQALNGGMDYDEAYSLFEKMDSSEVFELLKNDLRESTECYLRIHTPYIQFVDRYAECEKISVYKNNQNSFNLTLDIYSDSDLNVIFNQCEVTPTDDYDTDEFTEAFDDSKSYCLDIEDAKGNKIGYIYILF